MIMFPEDYLYILALRQCKNIGNANIRKFLNYLGSAKEVWESDKKTLLSINGIGKISVQDIGKKEILLNAEKELKLCEKQEISIICQNEKHYPKHLINCDDAPILLFCKGNPDNDLNHISIVGTRRLTMYGKHFVQDLMAELSASRVCTVSGLALGTDSCVHEESLRNRIPTIGVMAQSLDKIYPASNKNLAKNILENDGALITEYATFDGISKEYLLQRNRIIAGLSPQLIVVETAYGGGSVTTVTAANNYNRDVFALPGKITDTYSQGCNQLIAMNKAEAIVNIKTLVDNLNFSIQPELFPKEKQKIILDNAKAEHQKVLDIMITEKPVTLDEIAEKTGILHHKLLSILLDLEIYGFVQCLSGRQYQLI